MTRLVDLIGTELYRERMVRALAQDLQVPLLVLDSSVLAPYVRCVYMLSLPILHTKKSQIYLLSMKNLN